MTEQQTRPAPDTPQTDPGDIWAAAYNDDPKEFDRLLNQYTAEVEAEARQQVVEQIRERVSADAHSPNCEYGSSIIEALDEVAASRLPVREEERP